MFKYILFLINFIGYLLFWWLGEPPVSVLLHAPEEATAGSTIVVHVTINKGDIKGFGNFRQELPIGYTADKDSVSLGTFTFKDQRVVIGWLSLPDDSVIDFSYKIIIDPTAEGPLFLSGTFNYIESNERKSIESSSISITIRPTGFVTQVTDTSSTHYQQTANTDTAAIVLENVFCYRQVVKEQEEYTVNFLVNIADLPRDKFAKIQEIVPAGYTATAIETNEGIFSFKDNTVKFLWMSLPPQKQFIVTYKLIPSLPSNTEPTLSGSFSYIENGLTKIKTIQNREFLNTPLMASVQQQKQSSALTTQVTSQDNQQKTNQTNQQTNQQSNKQKQTDNTNQSKYQTTTQQQQQSQITQIPTPETGVKFKVQIAAGHRPVNPNYYFKQYQITEKVQMEQHEGWNKYTVGLFTAYKSARDKRVEIWQSTPIHDAFVSAYNNGTRITVQEALMIANQKWIQ